VKSFISHVPRGALLDEVRNLSFSKDSSGIEMASLQGKVPTWLKKSPAIQMAAAEIGKAKAVMVNRLPAHTVVPMHTDAEGGERYHLPVLTNEGALWMDVDNGYVHMLEGFWWGPVPYTIPHQVVNRGGTERIHIIVDCEAE
jgi:hypothetical protein